MGGLFPGALTLENFWHNIIHNIDSSREVPPDRWIAEADEVYRSHLVPDHAVSRHACLIEGFEFDPQGLNLEPDLLAALDPVYHITLHAGRQAFRNAQMGPVDKNRIGVIVAAIALPTDSSSALTRAILGKARQKEIWGDQAKDLALEQAKCWNSRVTGLPAMLLAKGLGLGGGGYTLDAACASSLYALKLACDELLTYRADAMLAGGVSRPECLYTQVGFSQLRALSPSGKCAPFDKKADGLVVGEGAGMFILKRMEDALRDGDEIHAVIHGIGLSNDVGGNLLAPDSEGQLRAMQMAYQKTNWLPNDIDLIECHGTGTPLGDKCELESLKTLWSKVNGQAGQCAIGSIKSIVGHLLTAAGAAGLMKVILALKHKTLPPSANFETFADADFNQAPFKVLTKPATWPRRNAEQPRRAAVSAFGFGGINAHVLLEEWGKAPATLKIEPQIKKTEPGADVPIAIVGMGVQIGSITSLDSFRKTVLRGESIIKKRPVERWRGLEQSLNLSDDSWPGAYIEELNINLGEFRIPPNEIPEILPQQLLMLQVAAQAMRDANLPLRTRRLEMGTIIGMAFDFESTNFHLRWNFPNEIASHQECLANVPTEDIKSWTTSIQDQLSPPLNATRTVGALGGIIASRIAKEFLLGGPSFVVSGEESSGLHALEIAVRLLRQGDVQSMLVGAIDLSGDIRSIMCNHHLRPYSLSGKISPFQPSADGTVVGEGAVALVLKRLDQAIQDNDRIYATVLGLGKASGGGMNPPLPRESAYESALQRAYLDAGIPPESISYVEAHGSGNLQEDCLEARSLHNFFANRSYPCAIGSVKPNIGHTGAIAGLASLVKTSLCLYQEIIPPLYGFTGSPAEPIWEKNTFHIPIAPQFWFRNRCDGPQRAGVSSITPDGSVSHVILEKHPQPIVAIDRAQPLGENSHALFVIEGDNPTILTEQIRELENYLQTGDDNLENLAYNWYARHGLNNSKKLAVACVFDNIADGLTQLARIRQNLATAPEQPINEQTIFYTPKPLAGEGEVAFVYPGSGSQYVEMGRSIGCRWPQILREMDATTERLQDQLLPHCYMPWRHSWNKGWKIEANQSIIANPHQIIFGQVVHGCMLTKLMGKFNIRPQAAIGYSLGESAALFALEAWPERGQMLKRMLASELFTSDLSGPCRAARKAWQVPEHEEVHWTVAIIKGKADEVRKAIAPFATARLLIVNAPEECVIGGRRQDVERAVQVLGARPFYIQGIITVHCEALGPVQDAYNELHLFPVTPPDNIRFYSNAFQGAYQLTSEKAAESILKQALHGFDFPATIQQAYRDGVRLFLEIGPNATCTRMIHKILDGKPYFAKSACIRGERDEVTILKFLGALIAQRVPVNLDYLYKMSPAQKGPHKSGRLIKVKTGGPAPIFPEFPKGKPVPIPKEKPVPIPKEKPVPEKLSNTPKMNVELITNMQQSIEATANAHNTYLNFAENTGAALAEVYSQQFRLLEAMLAGNQTGELMPLEGQTEEAMPVEKQTDVQPSIAPPPAFPREMCMEFAIGSIAKVLGPEFAAVDTYKVRVRLPDEPLMLVDRIMEVEGKKCSMGSGRVITEHDVLPNSWYLDCGRAPVCITVEAGQADLFLCSYLGIDLVVKGQRSYRLLDATIKFHRGLPQVGETMRYDIKIDKFINQGEVYLFFFHYKGTIGNTSLITMTGGCAGFFTREENARSGGIIFAPGEREPIAGKVSPDWQELVPVLVESYDEQAIAALRAGDLEGCFGPLFKGKKLAPDLCLPTGKMKLFDRVSLLDPRGGRYGLGIIRAEADIHPDDWFLTCHFVDDMVMPGTLMYECCNHTLRVFLLRMGWISEEPGIAYEPVPEIECSLRCRGPVTRETQKVIYEIEIKEIGYGPEPYVITDAFMYADGKRIVFLENISLQMTNLTRVGLENTWQSIVTRKKAIYDYERILAFSIGKPSEAFGEPYQIFDQKRVIARLPGPPYLFMDRVTELPVRPWVLEATDWIEGQYDIPPDVWYFKANRQTLMPFCVILEIVLQPCGWLAAYVGSALKSDIDLSFRNLGGQAILYMAPGPDTGTLTTRVRMTQVSEAGGMLIEKFDIQLWSQGQLLYDGNTYFGFFTKMALKDQVGIRDARERLYIPSPDESEQGPRLTLPELNPLTTGRSKV